MVGMGRKEATYNELENLDELKENIRVASGVGSRVLQEHGIEEIMVENFGDSEAAAEGAQLGIWQYQENKNDDDKRNEAKIDLFEGNREQWDRGILKADSQNIARCLCEIPGNILTPLKFAQVSGVIGLLLSVAFIRGYTLLCILSCNHVYTNACFY